jgi:hypothetical protein
MSMPSLCQLKGNSSLTVCPHAGRFRAAPMPRGQSLVTGGADFRSGVANRISVLADVPRLPLALAQR